MGQEEAAPAPAPPPPPVAEPPPYSLDLPDLHPQSSQPGLFPNGPRQNPPSTTATGAGRNGRNNGAGGSRRGRARDQAVEKADSDPLDVRVAYRRDKTVAMARDPGLAELLRRADLAGTDVEKRACLREYYNRLFASIRRMDSSPAMKTHLASLSQVASQRYDPQRRAAAGEEDLLNGNTSGRGRRGR